MGTFFDIYGWRIINRRYIREARFDKDNNTTIFMDGTGRNETVIMPGNCIDRLLASDAIVPAEPGFIALRYYSDNNIDEHPVIAWNINNDLALPVTPDWVVNESIREFCVQYPDGRIIAAGDREYPTREEWLKDMKEKEEKETKRALGL